MGHAARVLHLIFRLLITVWSFLVPLPAYPVRHYVVETVQEFVLPRGPEGASDPTVVYWEHAVQPAESWLAEPSRGLYCAECEEADILTGDCVDLWLVERPGRWVRLGELGAEGRPANGGVLLSAPFPLAGRRLVIFKELSGTLDPARVDARDWFADWPPPL